MTSPSAAWEELDRRARDDPRLERYRIRRGEAGALRWVPDGWHLSDAMARIAAEGGWWPGRWFLDHPELRDSAQDLVLSSMNDGWYDTEPEVLWAEVGTVWEKDAFLTPLLRHPVPTAPLLGFSSQALWWAMVFPTEEALLEGFLISHQELGFDEDHGGAEPGGVDPFFVQWVAQPPREPPYLSPEEVAGRRRVHARLQEARATWSTDHPCWLPGMMPLMTDERWPREAKAAVLGLPIDEIRP